MPDDAPAGDEIALPEGVELREGTEGLTPARIATLYRRAPLHRPTTRPEALREMFENASLVLAAWQGEQLVGVARILTDGVLHSYLCDLAVEPDVQRQGLGKALVDEVLHRLGNTQLVLRDSDLSAGFYEHLGFRRVENAWVLGD